MPTTPRTPGVQELAHPHPKMPCGPTDPTPSGDPSRTPQSCTTPCPSVLALRRWSHQAFAYAEVPEGPGPPCACRTPSPGPSTLTKRLQAHDPEAAGAAEGAARGAPRGRARAVLVDWARALSPHGVAHVMDASRRRAFQGCWLLLVLLAFGFLVYSTVGLVIEYTEYPTGTPPLCASLHGPLNTFESRVPCVTLPPKLCDIQSTDTGH